MRSVRREAQVNRFFPLGMDDDGQVEPPLNAISLSKDRPPDQLRRPNQSPFKRPMADAG